jgi:hypothetical protein
VERRSLRAALRTLVETTEITTCDNPVRVTGEGYELGGALRGGLIHRSGKG